MSLCPSVTTVLDSWADLSGIPAGTLRAAAERGSAVHRACGALASGLWAPPLPEEYAGYVQSFSRWFEAAVKEVILVEPAFVHPVYGYCGHPDMIVRLKGDSCLTLVDEKTPLSPAKTWRPQLAAYVELSEVNGYPIGRSLAARLRKSGAPALVNEYTGTLAGDLSVFLSCLTAWKYFKGA